MMFFKLKGAMRKIKMIYLDNFDGKMKVKYFPTALSATRFKERNDIVVRAYKRVAF